jgi:hypothetical protein
MSIRVFLVAATALSSAPAIWAQEAGGQNPWRLQDALDLPDTVRVEGHIRPRYEALANPFVAGRTSDDEFLGLQTQLRAEADFGDFTFGGELLDHRFITGNETGGAPGDIDALEPAQLYLSWRPKDFLGVGAETDLQAGRFTMDVGSRRLVARANFRSLLQSFDGVHAVWTSPADLTVTLAAVSPVSREPSDAASAVDNEVALNTTQDNTRLLIAHLDAPLPYDMRGELYLYDLDERDSADADTRNRDLSTLGVRLNKAPADNQFDFDIEFAHQTGTVRASTSPADLVPLDHDAQMAHLEAGFRFDAPWSPRLAVQYDHATGDASPTDASSERFDALFGDRSFEFGPTSLFGFISRTNLSSPGIRLEVTPSEISDAYVMLRQVNLESARDSLANTNVRDSSGASGDDAGFQIEGRYRHWLVEDSLRLSLGAALLLQGDFLDSAPNATGLGDPLYGYTELTWSF